MSVYIIAFLPYCNMHITRITVYYKYLYIHINTLPLSLEMKTRSSLKSQTCHFIMIKGTCYNISQV